MTFLPILAAAMMALKVFPSAEVTSLSPLGRPFFRESLRCESMGHNGRILLAPRPPDQQWQRMRL